MTTQKFYYSEWPIGKLLEARGDGLLTDDGEAWRYQYTHKDGKGKYDLLYRPCADTAQTDMASAAPTLEQEITDLIHKFDLESLSITGLRREDGSVYFGANAQGIGHDGERKCGTNSWGVDEPIALRIKEALGDLILKRAPVVELVELPAIEVKPGLKPAELTRDQWTYRGWQISFDMPPIPVRSFDWTATSPDYDVDCDQDGFHCAGGQQVGAATYEELLEEIENAIAAADDERAAA